MIVTARYPALAFGKTSQMKSRRTMLCVLETDVDIPELSIDDAPIAAITRSGAHEQVYRYADGLLYTRARLVRTCDPSQDNDCSVGLLKEVFSDPFTRKNYILDELMTEMQNAIGHMAAPTATRPEDLYRLLKTSGDPDLLAQGMANRRKIVIDDDVRADLERWERKAMDRFQSFAIIDGEAWISVAEPCLWLDVDNGEIHVANETPFRRNSPFWMEQADFLHDRYFSALDPESAEEAARSLLNGEKPDVHGTIEVFDTRPFVLDFPALEVERYSRVMARKFENELNYKNARTGRFIRDYPKDVIRAWAAMRAHMDSPGPLVGAGEEEVALLADFISAIEQCPAWDDHFKDTVVDPKVARNVLEAWYNRSIEFTDAPAMERF